MYLRAGIFFFQAEDGIRDLVRSRGLGDVYKRQDESNIIIGGYLQYPSDFDPGPDTFLLSPPNNFYSCLLYTSDAAHERSSVDLGGRRII